MYQSITRLLDEAHVSYARFNRAKQGLVLLTAGNQLIGAYEDLKRFASSTAPYAGWDVHHILEDQDLKRLGIANRFPPYPKQACVLVPKTAHAKRINSVLQTQNPTSMQAKALSLRHAHIAVHIAWLEITAAALNI